ncbi:hypothetical protein [Mangrovimonas spongiae]|uniref:DUF4345 domain-containing protein n=1 Tax=Mangrovimonas spongiae TaxID=2494697 RepID=A0A428K6U6_9FLAO|nr:hypothetical protein [Mangrovimonas spongiae]RSK42051.1 hypothetical protein EJA19_03990 [Mangrovimonas spongiae]
MIIHIKIAGYLLLVLACIHIAFPKYFKWNKELKHLSLINNQMMRIHTFFIAITVGLMGLLCITSSVELTETLLGKKTTLGLGVFWSFRLLFQFFVYSPKLWKGKIFETVIHILFSLLWLYFSFTFLLTYYMNKL